MSEDAQKKDKEWKDETQRRLMLVAQYFKPRENQVISDFIVTAGTLDQNAVEEAEIP